MRTESARGGEWAGGSQSVEVKVAIADCQLVCSGSRFSEKSLRHRTRIAEASGGSSK